MNVRQSDLDEISQTFMELIKISVESRPASSLVLIHLQHSCCASSEQLSHSFSFPCLQPAELCWVLRLQEGGYNLTLVASTLRRLFYDSHCSFLVLLLAFLKW